MLTLSLPERFRITLAALVGFAFIGTAPAQQEIGVDIYGTQAAAAVRIAVPFPDAGASVLRGTIDPSLYQPLLRDLAFAEIFSLVAMPPGAQNNIEAARRAGAQAFVKMSITRESDDYVIEVRLYDVATQAIHMGRRYRGKESALTRIAHTIANDLVLYFNGKPGVFLSQIAFVSNRDGNKEIYLMDYDGSNQRRITFHNSLSITPDWSPDNERLVYTSFARGTSDLYIVNRRGGGRFRIDTGVGLNTSPTFSPDGKTIAFVGSVRGNPDIYTISDDGSGMRRLTTGTSIESTPAWSPTGRQISFTSSRSGSPQIYVMDAEGTNVRRISFEGEWNDDATWAPSGDLLAYTSRVNGRFQIRLMNLATQQSSVIAGEGSNEQPAWSPDGKSLVFMSNRTGRWQIYRIGVDGRRLQQLTSQGLNSGPDWSKTFN